MKDSAQENSKRKKWLKPILLVLILISLLIISRYLGLGQKLGEIRDWIKNIGYWGPVVFILIYAIATVALIPGSALTVIAGAIFGSLLGIIIVSIASTLGASLSFLVGRYFARESVGQWLNKQEKFRRLDELTEKHGAIIVAITRLVPLFPFTFLNYGFGLTKVDFKIYVFWSWLCMLPGTILYVVGADTVTKIIANGKTPWVMVGVFVISIVFLTFLVRHARNILKRKENEI